MAYQLFLDTEFTDLSRPEFLSAGLVAVSHTPGLPDRELYLCIDPLPLEKCSEFVVAQVLPQIHLPCGCPIVKGSRAELGAALIKFLDSFSQARVEIVSDFVGDFRVLEQLLVKNNRQFPGFSIHYRMVSDVLPYAFAAPTNYLNKSRELLNTPDTAHPGVRAHHSLFDARCMAKAVQYTHLRASY